MSSDPIQFKQWTTTQDGLAKLKLESASISPDSLQEDEVLVKIHTVSLNYRDTEGMFAKIKLRVSFQQQASQAYIYCLSS